MDSNESLIRQELSTKTTEELESLIEIHFFWKEDVPQDMIRNFHLRQSVARELLNQRQGVVEDEQPVTGSVWSRKATF